MAENDMDFSVRKRENALRILQAKVTNMAGKIKAPPSSKKPNSRASSSHSRTARSSPSPRTPLKVKVIIHDAEEGGFWAEVPALPGCFTEGETREELLANLREAIEGILLGPEETEPLGKEARVEEIRI